MGVQMDVHCASSSIKRLLILKVCDLISLNWLSPLLVPDRQQNNLQSIVLAPRDDQEVGGVSDEFGFVRGSGSSSDART